MNRKQNGNVHHGSNVHLENHLESGKPLLKVASDHLREEEADKQAGCGSQEVLRCIVLVLATFCAHVLSAGMSFSLGVYYVEFLTAFNQGSGITSLITSINFGMLCAAGPVSSFMVHKLGCANIIIIGGLISSIGIFLCYFANNVYFVFATFGVTTGFGYGLVFASCLTQITCYIHRWRAVCNGVAMSGVGMGIMINPLVTEYLISAYTWRGALLITSALTMNICVCGFIIRITNCIPSEEILKQDVYVNDILVTDANFPATENSIQEKAALDKESDSKEKHSMWTNPIYWCLHINIILFCFGQSIVFTHIAAFAISKGFTQLQSSSLISVLGVSNTTGRILLGIVATIPRVNVNILHIVLIILSGLFTLCCTFWQHYYALVSLLTLMGIALSEYGPVLCEVTVNIVGVPKFARGYGFLLVSMAIGTLLGAPLAGKLYDLTQVYENSFYLGAASFVASALVLAVAIVIRHTFVVCKGSSSLHKCHTHK